VEFDDGRFGGRRESRRDFGREKKDGSGVEIRFSLLEELGGAERNSHGETQYCSLYTAEGERSTRSQLDTSKKNSGDFGISRASPKKVELRRSVDRQELTARTEIYSHSPFCGEKAERPIQGEISKRRGSRPDASR